MAPAPSPGGPSDREPTPGLTLGPLSGPVAPGSSASLVVGVRNDTAVVERFGFSARGEAAAWTTFEPPDLALMPGDAGAVVAHLCPPQGTAAGNVPFAVVAQRTTDGVTQAEEAVLVVAGAGELDAALRPVTSHGWRRARHVVAVRNVGNLAVNVRLDAWDADDQLALVCRPATATLQPGQQADIGVAVTAHTRANRFEAPRQPFTVRVTPSDGPIHDLAGVFVQHRRRRLVPVLVAAAVAALVLVAGVAYLRSDGARTGVAAGAPDADTTTSLVAAAELVDQAEPDGAAAPPATATDPASGPAAPSQLRADHRSGAPPTFPGTPIAPTTAPAAAPIAPTVPATGAPSSTRAPASTTTAGTAAAAGCTAATARSPAVASAASPTPAADAAVVGPDLVRLFPLVNDVQPSAGGYTITAVSAPAPGVVAISPEHQSFLYNPHGATGAQALVVTTTDAAKRTRTSKMTVTVRAAPTGTAPQVATCAKTRKRIIDLTTQPAGKARETVVGITPSPNGALAVAADGLTVDYIPADGFKGSFTLVWSTQTAAGAGATRKVTVTVR